MSTSGNSASGNSTARNSLRPPHRLIVEPLLRRALEEDLGEAGDLTTEAIVPAAATTVARVVVRKPGRVAGVRPALEVFRLLDPACEITILVDDGEDAAAGTEIARIEGPAGAILTAERTALNLLGRLCGIATTTRDLVASLGAARTRIVCTRKTTPGLRALEKYAVRCGGGTNHRFGLDDAVLIKDNHIAIAGSVEEAVARARAGVGHMVKIQLEVDSLEQLEEALAIGVDAVLLDNFTLEGLEKAVALCDGRVLTEASGGISPETAPGIAATGVDQMSVGWLTHSAPNLDVGLDV